MSQAAVDAGFMARALQLAAEGLYSTSPNPRVGCVLVNVAGEVVGEGFHVRAGQAHAEVHALQQAGDAARGATAYVTLEPCSHHGRTGPCADALIAAGIARVVYAIQDPNPQVSGRGLTRLREAGIQVDGPVLETEARLLNRGFIKRMQTGLPWVCLKMAMSLDGRTAMASGQSQWITGEAARRDVQQMRARSCAIVTAAGTVLADDAQLTVREPDLQYKLRDRKPLRVLLDRYQHVDLSARIFDGSAPTLWCTAHAPTVALPQHVEHCLLPTTRDDGLALLQALANRQCNEVMVEAGATLAGRWLQQQLIDELVIYMAPKLLGSTARPLFSLPFDEMAQAHNLQITDVRAVGNDWRFTAVPVKEKRN